MKLSITIATYNVQNFIRESVESILNQTFQDFEVICIDDGSKDNTVSILKEFASKDNRIQIVEKEVNEGLAVARNLSLELARGEYVTFLDGDDFYDLTLFEKAVNLADKTQADLVLWDYVTFYQANEIPKLKAIPSDLLNFDTSDKLALLQRPSFTWVKLLRTQKAKSLGIHFPKGFTRQDIPVHWHLITKLSKIEVLPERLAYYRQQNEATTAKKDKKLFHLVFVMDVVEKYLKDEKLFEIYKHQFYTQQLNFFHGMYDNIQEEYKTEALELINERLSNDHIKFLKTTNYVRPQTKLFLLGLKGDSIATFKLKIWVLTRKIYRLAKRN
jgi:glycosyltransferase involved in cell wall biosynthesis